MASIRTVGCSPYDAAAVKLYLQGDRGSREADQLAYRTLAVAAWDSESGSTTGYLSLDDAPALCNDTGGSIAAGGAAAEAAASLGYKHSTTVYMQQLQAQEGPTLQRLLQHAFLSMPHLQQVLLVSNLDFDADIQQQQQQQHAKGIAVPDAAVTFFSKASCISDAGPWLYVCSRPLVLPPLQIRHAKVEDHDDLLPIVEAAAAGPCPSLAALPLSCDPEQPFALTRLISSQDAENRVLVAEEDGKLVGLLVATLQLDVSLLIQAFDLGFCDAFMPSEVYEECEAAAKHAAAEKVQQQCSSTPSETMPAPAAAEATAEQIRQELVPLLVAASNKRQKQKQPKCTAPQAAHNLVAVTMLCMQPGYEERAIDFMPALFAELPSQDYCALTLPHSAAQPMLARHMTMLSPVPGSSFPQVVLLLHRASLALQMGAEWEVRLALPDDVTGLHALMGSMSNSMELQQAFLHSVGRQGAVVAAVNGELIGMLATSPCTAEGLDSWTAGFNLARLSVEQHVQLDAGIISPVFSAQAGAMLAAAVRLLNASYMHYILAPGQPAPGELLAFMQQQGSRQSRSGSLIRDKQGQAGAGDSALFSFTKSMAFMPRIVVNAQVVIAGASETGLSCLERLLLQPCMRFTNLTLLAPGGVQTDSVTGCFTAAQVARLGLHANVTMVDSHMVALEPEDQILMLADGTQLPFDLLAVATGLQDQLGPAVAGAFPDAAQFVLSAQQLLASSITPELADSLHSVLVYGADLQALDVLTSLISAGVNADAITWVCPGAEQEATSLPLLRGLAAQLGLELPEPQQGRLLDLNPSPDGTRGVAALQALDAGDDGPLQQMELDLLIGCGSLQPSAVVASCLAGAYIVWDGRLVVDAQFCSSNGAVMGAGPVVKFSRRYSLPEVKQEHYNSSELGVALADAIIRRFASLQPALSAGAAALTPSGSRQPPGSSAVTAPASGPEEVAAQQAPQQQPDRLPPLQQGKVLGCRMPGGQVFTFCGCPAAVAAPQLQPPPGGCTVLSCTADKAGVLNICLDERSSIHHVAFVGTAESSGAMMMTGLVGLPFSYVAAGLSLPDMLASHLAATGLGNGAQQDASRADMQQATGFKLSAGPEPGVWLLDQDVVSALQQPWSQVLMHDNFSALRQQLLADEHQGDGHKGKEDQMQQAMVAFKQKCCNELPGYHLSVAGSNAVC